MFFTRFEMLGQTEDLDNAVNVSRQAESASTPGHPSRVVCLSSLGNYLGTRFQHAVATTDMAMKEAPFDCHHRSAALANLAT
ncbi:hypothetical protein MKX08_001154 [Trichoderma sp. CBMAI-0020]|nr:hypothetical protein MKX08_001154 [Trichoderma sp. CBMAI-0020]